MNYLNNKTIVLPPVLLKNKIILIITVSKVPRLCKNSNLWIFVFNFDLKTFSTMNIDGDLRLIRCFIDTATHCQRRKISFYT
jgi:hypothetical protein